MISMDRLRSLLLFSVIGQHIPYGINVVRDRGVNPTRPHTPRDASVPRRWKPITTFLLPRYSANRHKLTYDSFVLTNYKLSAQNYHMLICGDLQSIVAICRVSWRFAEYCGNKKVVIGFQ